MQPGIRRLHHAGVLRIRSGRAEGRPAERSRADIAAAAHRVAPAAVRDCDAPPASAARPQSRWRLRAGSVCRQRHHRRRRRKRAARKLPAPVARGIHLARAARQSPGRAPARRPASPEFVLLAHAARAGARRHLCTRRGGSAPGGCRLTQSVNEFRQPDDPGHPKTAATAAPAAAAAGPQNGSPAPRDKRARPRARQWIAAESSSARNLQA